MAFKRSQRAADFYGDIIKDMVISQGEIQLADGKKTRTWRTYFYAWRGKLKPTDELYSRAWNSRLIVDDKETFTIRCESLDETLGVLSYKTRGRLISFEGITDVEERNNKYHTEVAQAQRDEDAWVTKEVQVQLAARKVSHEPQ
jgi:hypothetical protein